MNFLSTLTGCFAQPVAENPTVAMIEAAYKHHGMDWRYINCEVAPENLGAAVRGACEEFFGRHGIEAAVYQEAEKGDTEEWDDGF